MIEVNPTSQRWKEICEIEDEQTQSRAIKRYVFELENKVSSYETESSNLRKENYDMRKNILSSKKEIEGSLDTLNIAFEKLLDRLFQDQAWDVSSDISVLKTMIAQDGLAEEDF